MCFSIYLPLLLLIIETTSVKEEYFFDKANLDKVVSIHISMQGHGILDFFIKNLLDLLTTVFPPRKLKGYLSILSKEVQEYNFKYTKELAKYLKDLSKEYREEIVEELKELLEECDKRPPRRKEFLDLLNPAYTLRENLLFKNYVLDLKDYGTEDKLFIDEETKKVLRFIVEPIQQMSKKDQHILEKKLKRALREYRNELPTYKKY